MERMAAIRRASVILVAGLLMFCMGLLATGCAENYTPEQKSPEVSGSALHEDGVLRVGVDTSNAPYAAESSGAIMGIDVDIAAALADQLGLKVEIVDVGSNVASAFSEDEVDVVMGVEAVSESYWTSEPYMESAIVLFAASANMAAPSTGSFKIAAQSSSMSAWQVTDHFGEEHLVSEADLKTAFESLESGDVEYVAADSTIGAYVAHTLGITAYPVALLQEPTQYHLACELNNTTLQDALETALTDITDSGLIGVINAKWLGGEVDLENLPLIEPKAPEVSEEDNLGGAANAVTDNDENGDDEDSTGSASTDVDDDDNSDEEE